MASNPIKCSLNKDEEGRVKVSPNMEGNTETGAWPPGLGISFASYFLHKAFVTQVSLSEPEYDDLGH